MIVLLYISHFVFIADNMYYIFILPRIHLR